jgi:hypothetical protein
VTLAQSTAAYQHRSSIFIRVSKTGRTHHEPVCDPVGSYTGAPNTDRGGAVFLQDVDRSQSTQLPLPVPLWTPGRKMLRRAREQSIATQGRLAAGPDGSLIFRKRNT